MQFVPMTLQTLANFHTVSILLLNWSFRLISLLKIFPLLRLNSHVDDINLLLIVQHLFYVLFRSILGLLFLSSRS